MKRRYTLIWSEAAKEGGRTFTASQREAAVRQANALRDDPTLWISSLTYLGVSAKGRKLWHIPGAEVQLIFYIVGRNQVYIHDISTRDIPPLEERD